jgi:lipoyl(octanoyl) transferase
MVIEVKNSVKAVDYLESMDILEQRVLDVLSGKKKELLWVLEHKSVYTAGTSSNKSDVIDKKINIIKTNRGGKHTFHGPGQKIVYFVLDLNKRFNSSTTGQ